MDPLTDEQVAAKRCGCLCLFEGDHLLHECAYHMAIRLAAATLQWQPIATAKQDPHEFVLLHSPAWPQPEVGWWVDDSWLGPYWAYGQKSPAAQRAQPPTHWLAIPELVTSTLTPA
jgi:hypothetical protein